MLFACIVSWGVCTKTLTQRTFREKSLGTSKASSKRSGVFGAKVLRIFKGLFQKPLKARFGTQFQLLTTIKKTRQCRVFSCKRYQLGRLPQTLTRKVPWNLKSFTKIKWCILREILWHTFLIRKVWVSAYFSFKKSRRRICAKTEKLSFRATQGFSERENSHTEKTRSASPL